MPASDKRALDTISEIREGRRKYGDNAMDKRIMGEEGQKPQPGVESDELDASVVDGEHETDFDFSDIGESNSESQEYEVSEANEYLETVVVEWQERGGTISGLIASLAKILESQTQKKSRTRKSQTKKKEQTREEKSMQEMKETLESSSSENPVRKMMKSNLYRK